MTRIALCISGQPRGIPLSIELTKKALIEPNGNVDVFLHAWHDEADVGKPYNSAQPPQNGRVGTVQANTANTLISMYSPVKYVIEPQRQFPDLAALPNTEYSAVQDLLGSNFYSVWRANELKKEHENEQGFKYDVVIRTRYDIFYRHQISVSDYMEPVQQGKVVLMNRFQRDQDAKQNSNRPMTDIFAVGNSKTMDIFSGVFPEMKRLNALVSPPFGENYLGQWVTVENGVEPFYAPFDFEILHRVIPQ